MTNNATPSKVRRVNPSDPYDVRYVDPYTCRDQECRAREQAGKRCPWCWGGFPSK